LLEILASILKKTKDAIICYPKLLVGNSSKDDAATYDLGKELSVLSTTVFFMPRVADLFKSRKLIKVI
jgi:selenide,water dikinase